MQIDMSFNHFRSLPVLRCRIPVKLHPAVRLCRSIWRLVDDSFPDTPAPAPYRPLAVGTSNRVLKVSSRSREAADGMDKGIHRICAFAGLRRSEAQGLRWCDIDDDYQALVVRQTLWQSEVNAPKSKASGDWVPIIPPLAQIIREYREWSLAHDKIGVWTQPDSRLFRYTLDHIGRKKVGVAFKRAGLVFSGYHSFRRGLASILFELGLDDLTVMRILRHGSVQVTRAHYIKLRDSRLNGAMERLAAAWQTGCERAASGAGQ